MAAQVLSLQITLWILLRLYNNFKKAILRLSFFMGIFINMYGVDNFY